MTNKASVIDSSALLAIIYNEEGTDKAQEYFDNSYMSVVNAVECITVLTRNGMPLDVAKNLLESIISKFIPCEYNDVVLITQIKNENKNVEISLGDGICIALGAKLGLKVITTDKAWINIKSTAEVICLR
jgi:PIN domain nuclease of toxin-antitoxin system